jgi:hypothetical protein
MLRQFQLNISISEFNQATFGINNKLQDLDINNKEGNDISYKVPTTTTPTSFEKCYESGSYVVPVTTG